tara:strand:- start:969 stop:1445 length:477 start_codon:yes stop_codon:yes gene_type:complete
LAQNVKRSIPEPAKAEILTRIDEAFAYLNELPPVRENDRMNLVTAHAWSLALTFYTIGNAMGLAKYEFGPLGAIIAREKFNIEARARGGASQKARVAPRDRQIISAIQGHLDEGRTYAWALREAWGKWFKHWGVWITLEAMRNRFPKKRFTSQTPCEK